MNSVRTLILHILLHEIFELNIQNTNTNCKRSNEFNECFCTSAYHKATIHHILIEALSTFLELPSKVRRYHDKKPKLLINYNYLAEYRFHFNPFTGEFLQLGANWRNIFVMPGKRVNNQQKSWLNV